jgi:hypothetical protein
MGSLVKNALAFVLFSSLKVFRSEFLKKLFQRLPRQLLSSLIEAAITCYPRFLALAEWEVAL